MKLGLNGRLALSKFTQTLSELTTLRIDAFQYRFKRWFGVRILAAHSVPPLNVFVLLAAQYTKPFRLSNLKLDI
jgi:hypothetical protein